MPLLTPTNHFEAALDFGFCDVCMHVFFFYGSKALEKMLTQEHVPQKVIFNQLIHFHCICKSGCTPPGLFMQKQEAKC